MWSRTTSIHSRRKFSISAATRLARVEKKCNFMLNKSEILVYSVPIRCQCLMVLIKSNTLGRYHDKYIISINKHKMEGYIKYKQEL
jgi:hypothetical protein